MTITINNQDYTLKNTVRAYFLFEQISGKAFEIKTYLDQCLLFYSMLLANNKDTFTMDWDEFCDALDNDPTLTLKFQQMMLQSQQLDKILADKGSEENGVKKN